MKHCLEFWQANHDIQPSLSPYATDSVHIILCDQDTERNECYNGPSL